MIYEITTRRQHIYFKDPHLILLSKFQTFSFTIHWRACYNLCSSMLLCTPIYTQPHLALISFCQTYKYQNRTNTTHSENGHELVYIPRLLRYITWQSRSVFGLSDKEDRSRGSPPLKGVTVTSRLKGRRTVEEVRDF